MADYKCGECSREASSLCSRCCIVAYCSAHCQKTNWQTHKLTCDKDYINKEISKKSTALINKIKIIIGGDIATLVAHKTADIGNGIVVVRIQENINDLIQNNCNDVIANISFIRVGAFPVYLEDNNISWLYYSKDELIKAYPSTFVLFRFNDFTGLQKMKLFNNKEMKQLRKKTTEPTNRFCRVININME